MTKITVLIFLGLFLLVLANANAEQAPAKPEVKTETKTPAKKETSPTNAVAPGKALPKDVKKLVVEDTIVGNGKLASKGKTIKVHYTGWLYDPSKSMGRGREFDSSEGQDPFQFVLGGRQVIKGWDEGFENMKVGGKRKLIIPSEMAYGAGGAGDAIPPNAPLMFEVELLDVL